MPVSPRSPGGSDTVNFGILSPLGNNLTTFPVMAAAKSRSRLFLRVEALQSMPEVRGNLVDAQTRCAHYDSRVDVIAIKMKCCDAYFACKDCHDELADHVLEPWPLAERAQLAVLCGICGSELTIAQYLESSAQCPACKASFNPRCSEHYDYYFSDQSALRKRGACEC
jgi:uncharacterized CHY-type Zn-finger protein